jgi:hypothetical protein
MPSGNVSSRLWAGCGPPALVPVGRSPGAAPVAFRVHSLQSAGLVAGQYGLVELDIGERATGLSQPFSFPRGVCKRRYAILLL